MKVIFISLSLILIIMIGLGYYSNNQVPDNLGVKKGKLAALPSSPNAVSSQTKQQDKYVEALEFKGDLKDSRRQILSILKQNPQVTILKQRENYIHAVEATPTMGFKDDVEFYFDSKEEVIHFRSASRIGRSDFGTNRQRYNQIKEKYYQ